MKKPKLRTPKEKEIQKAILDWLQWQGVYCWKNNNVGIYKVATGTYIPSGMKGVSDILGIIKGGIFLAIEVKAKKGKLSSYQEEFLANITRNGGIAFVAKCIEDVELSLKDYFL